MHLLVSALKCYEDGPNKESKLVDCHMIVSSGPRFCHKFTSGGNHNKNCTTTESLKLTKESMPNLNIVAKDGCYTGKVRGQDAEMCLCSKDGCNPATSISDFYSKIIALTPFIIIIKTLVLGLY